MMATNLCNRCKGEIDDPRFKMCSGCRGYFQKINERRRKGKLKRGECLQCSEPVKPGRSSCQECLDAQAKRSAEFRARREAFELKHGIG